MTGRLCRIAAWLAITVLLLCLYLHSLLEGDNRQSRADAIVLLAGAWKERVPAAAKLYREGCAPKIVLTNDGVISGWSPRHNRNLYNIEWAEEELVKGGVPRAAIVKLPFHGSGTIYDALATRELAIRDGFRSLLIVTADYHVFRSRLVFRYVFRDRGILLSVRPVASRRILLRYYFLEGAKIGYYGLRYFLLHNFGLKLNGFEI